MARIEAFYAFGKILGMFQKLNPPQFVILLKNEVGEILPIYEGNNDVSPGNYDIYTYQPYKINGEKTTKAGWVSVGTEKTIYVVILSITGMLSAFAHKEDNWSEYVKSKGAENIQRHIGWYANQAQKMLHY